MPFRLFAAVPLCLVATAALAAGSSAPFDYKPDPALKLESRTKLQERVRKACAVTQAKLRNVTQGAMGKPCGCYASATLGALDAAEIDAYRNTGYFNDTARAKALAALDACKLQRPV